MKTLNIDISLCRLKIKGHRWKYLFSEELSATCSVKRN